MNLSKARFAKGSFNFRRTADSAVETVARWSYETGSTLYDVVVIDGTRLYSVNCGTWSHAPSTIHTIIVNHYEVDGADRFVPVDGVGRMAYKGES